MFKFGDPVLGTEGRMLQEKGEPCYLNVSFELLIVDINGVLAAVIRTTPMSRL